MERPTIDGDSPVSERADRAIDYLSTTGHEESRGKLGGPPPKAKYQLTTDSELVP